MEIFAKQEKSLLAQWTRAAYHDVSMACFATFCVNKSFILIYCIIMRPRYSDMLIRIHHYLLQAGTYNKNKKEGGANGCLLNDADMQEVCFRMF